MKPEEQRIAIAKACGWKLVEDNPDYEPYWEDPKGNMIAKVGSQIRLPNYLNDLNAMHEAVKFAQNTYINIEKDPFWCNGQYSVNLNIVLGRNYWDSEITLTEATAAKRAEAFLKTLELWVE